MPTRKLHPHKSPSILGFYRKSLLSLVVITLFLVILTISLDSARVIDMSQSRWRILFAEYARRYTLLGFGTFESLTALRSRVSREIDLKTAILVYKDEVNPNKMKFRQKDSCKKLRNTETGCVTDYNTTFYTVERQKTCAIVGSSGILRGSGCGEEINSHDFVMRANLPPIKGFENDVGNRTNLAALNRNNIYYMYGVLTGTGPRRKYRKRFVKALKSMNDGIIWLNFNLMNITTRQRLPVVLNKTLGNGRRRFRYRVGYSYVPVFPSAMNKIWNKDRHSEGFVMLTIASLFCDKIDMYGFWPFSTDTHGHPVSYYYFQNLTFNMTGRPMPTEFTMLQKMSQNGVVNLVTSNCTAVNRTNNIAI